MRKTFLKILLSLFAITFVAGCNKQNNPDQPQEDVWHDYVADLKFDPSSGRVSAEVTVKNYIDGDTTHFTIEDDFFQDHTLKARYLGIDTPESTGKVQPYGKKASKFTESKLKTASSIIVESQENQWLTDSTGGRYLVWVWYQPNEGADYRLLNLELLQQGLTAGKNYSSLTYGSYFSDAYTQAIKFNLGCVGNVKDDEFWYDGAQEITLKELRLNPEDYNGTKVRFECYVGKISVSSSGGYTIYVYDYDEETDIEYGFQVFCGFTNYEPLETIGNRVSLCGACTYYETGKIYQLSSIQISIMRRFPDDTYSIPTYDVLKDFEEYHVGDTLDEEKFNALDFKYWEGMDEAPFENEYLKLRLDDPKYTPVTGADLNGNTKVTITVSKLNEETGEYEDEDVEYAKPALLLHSLISATNLTIKKVSITKTSSSYGAATFTCTDQFGNEISVRTVQFRDSNNAIIDLSGYVGKVINAKGIMDYYSFADSEETDPNGYQLKVLDFKDLEVIG